MTLSLYRAGYLRVVIATGTSYFLRSVVSLTGYTRVLGSGYKCAYQDLGFLW